MEKGYSVTQTAELLGLKPRTVRWWIHEGRIEAHKLNGTNRWFVFEREIKRLRNEDGTAKYTE